MIHRAIFLSIAGLMLSACAGNSVTDEEAEALFEARKGEQVNRVCFSGSIDGFGETTRNTIVVSEGLDRFLLETFNGCYGLDRAQSITFDSFSSCLTRGDDVIPFESFTGPDDFGPKATPCKIKAIYEWDRDAEIETDEDEEDVHGEAELGGMTDE